MIGPKTSRVSSAPWDYATATWRLVPKVSLVQFTVNFGAGAYAWTCRSRLEDVVSFYIKEPFHVASTEVKITRNAAGDEFYVFRYNGELCLTKTENAFVECWGVSGFGDVWQFKEDEAYPTFEVLEDYEIP